MGKTKRFKILSIVLMAFVLISVIFYCALKKTNIQFIANNPVLKMFTDLTDEQNVANEGETVVFTNTATTSIQKQKVWQGVGDASLYTVTFTLYEETTSANTSEEKIEVDGKYYVPTYNENSAKYESTITGNDVVTFENLPKYNDNGEINYKVIETKVEFKESAESTEIIELQYGDDYVSEEENGVITNTPVAQKDFDIALRKSITGIQRNNEDVTASAITENRLPVINETSLQGLESPDTTLYYYHPKYAINVENEDIVTYTITVFNEGERSGFASEITDYIPEGLEFINNDFNKSYGWEVVLDNSGNIYKDENGSTAIKTKYLSSEAQGGSDDNILNAIEITKPEEGTTGETGTELTQTTFQVLSKEVKVQLKVTKEPNTQKDEYLTNRAEITVYGYYNSANQWKEANAENIDIDSIENTINNTLGLPSWYASHVINSTPTIDNYYPGAQDDDDFETVMLSKTYGTQIELNKLGSVDQENIAGATFKISDITTDSDLEIKIYNKLSGVKIETQQDGSFVVPVQGIILDLSQMIKNKEYQIQINEISAPEGFAKTLDNLVLSVSLDDNEVVSAQIIKLVNENGEEENVLNQNTAKLENADETGKVQVGLNADDSNITIQYKLGEDGEWQDYTEDVKVYENTTVYAKTIKDGVESEVSFKVINNIDKVAPDLESYTENGSEDIETSINVILTDDASGIVKYGISASSDTQPETYQHANQEKRLETTIDHIENNGTNYVWIWDAAGNNAVKEVEITTVNSDLYVAEITAASEGYEDLIGTQYKTLAAALAACPSLGNGTATVSLIHDIYNESNSVDKEVTIDLNGYTLTSRKNAATLAVAENSTLTLINSKTAGELKNEKTMAVLVNETGTFTMGVSDESVGITQPSISGIGIGVRNNGTFNFYDGNITATQNESLIASAIYGKVTDQPLLYSVSVKEGTDDIKSQQATLAQISNAEARIGRKVYTKLEDAITDAGTVIGKDGSQVEIILVADLVKEETVVVDETKNIKLNLDGHSLTTGSSSYVIENYGELEIVDTSEAQTGIITSTTNSTIYNTSTGEFIGEKINIDLSNVKKYSENDEYYFIYDEDADKLVSTNNTKTESLNTSAIGYLELDLTDYEGRYTLEVDAEISSYSYYGHGYISISNEPDSNEYMNSDGYGNIINISAEDSIVKSIDLVGGQKYVLNFKYQKDSKTSFSVDDEFRINSVSIRKKQEGKLTLTSGTIKVEKTGNYSNYYSAISNSGIVNVNGGNLISTKAYTACIDTKNGATSNVVNGNIKSSISSNYIALRSAEKNSLLCVKGGNITGYYGVYTNQNSANAIVTGGVFDCNYDIYNNYNYSLITIDGITLEDAGCSYNVYNNATLGKIIINNSEIKGNNCIGIFNGETELEINNSDIIATSRAISSNYDSNISVNNSYIETFNGLYGGYKSYSTLKLNNSQLNMTYDYNAIDSFYYVTVENSSIYYTAANSTEAAIYCQIGGNINILGNTQITTVGAVIYSEGTNTLNVNIKSGTLESTKSQILYAPNNSGTIILGEKDGNVLETPLLKAGASGWTIDGNNMNLKFYDGKVIGKLDQVIGAKITELEDNKQLVSTINAEGKEEVTLGEIDAVAKILETGEIYDSLADAIDACSLEAGETQTTIQLLKNVLQTTQLKIRNGQNIKIDLNGNKLNAMVDNTFYNEGKLELVDTAENSAYEQNIITTGSTILQNAAITNEDSSVTRGYAVIGSGINIYYRGKGTSSSYKTAINNSGDLIYDGATIQLSSDGTYVKVINNINEATFTMQAGEINLNGPTYIYGVYNDNTANAVFESGSINISNTYEYAIYNNSTNSITVNEVEGKEVFAISQNGSRYTYGIYNNLGTVYIENINMTGSVANNDIFAIYNKKNLTIDSGNITGNYSNSYYNGVIYCYTDSVNTINNCTINVDSASSCIASYKPTTVNINNCSIISNYTSSNGKAIYARESGTVNIQNTQITSIQIGIYNEGGTTNLKTGSVVSTSNYAIYNTATINIGEKITEEGINNGEVASTTNPIIKGATYGLYNKATANFYDGAITGQTGKSVYGNINDKETGYQVVKITDDENSLETSILQQLPIVEIEGVGQYSTIAKLQEAIDGLDNTQEYTIKAVDNFSISASEPTLTIPENMVATFDLAGCTINSYNMPTITNNGTLTILDSSTDAAGVFTNDNTGTFIQNNGTMYLKSGKINVNGNGSSSSNYKNGIVNNGTMEINGAKITNNQTSAASVRIICNEENANLTISSGTITGSYAYIYNNSVNDLSISNATITCYEITNNNTGNIVINDGSTVSSNKSSAIYNKNTGNVIINGGTISSSDYDGAIYNYGLNSTYGNVSIYGGNIIGTVQMNGGELIIDGESFVGENVQLNGSTEMTMKNGTINSISISGDGVVANIYGGNIITSTNNVSIELDDCKATVNIGNKDDETVSQTNPNIVGNSTYKIITDAENAKINYYDGKITYGGSSWIDSTINEIPEGYEQNIEKLETTSTVTLVQPEGIATVNNVPYNTLQDAINACTEENNTIIIQKDFCITKGNYTVDETDNIILDLNGKRIYAYEPTSLLINNGTLEIKDDSTEQTGNIYGYTETFIENNNKLTISGGIYRAYNYTYKDSDIIKKVINNKGNLLWNNGQLYLTQDTYNTTQCGIYNTGDGILNWKNGYTCGTDSSGVYGNQYLIYTDSTGNVTWENGKINLIGNWEGNQCGMYIKGPGTVDIDNIIALNDGFKQTSITFWTTSKQYIIYTENTNEDKNIVNINNLQWEKIDREGYLWSINAHNSIVNISGGLYLGSECRNYRHEGLSCSNSEINIYGGTFEDMIYSAEASDITINDGTISKLDMYVYNEEDASTVTINGGTITQFIDDSSNNTTPGILTVTMNAGTIKNTNGNAVQLGNSSVFTHLGGTIESENGYGVYINGTNGTFIMGNNQDAVETTLPTVVGSTYGVYNASGKFYFYDGNITGATKALYGKVTDTPENYKVVYSSDETIATLEFTAEVENIVTVNDSINYETIEAAISAAIPISGTVKLHKDLELTAPLEIPADANITINLNAHILSYAGTNSAIINNGTLAIIDDVGDDYIGDTVEAKLENAQGSAITNNGTLTIGVNDEEVNTITPNIVGTTQAIVNNGTLNLYDGLLNGTPVTVGTTVATTKTHIITKSAEEEISIYKLAQREKLNTSSILQFAKTAMATSVMSPTISVDKELPVWTNEYVVMTIEAKDRVVLNITNTEKNMYVVKINKTDENGEELQGITFTTQATDINGDAIEMPDATIENEVTTTGNQEPLTIITNKITEDTVDVVDYFEITETVVPKEYYGLASSLKLTIEKELNTETGFYDISSFAINGNTDTDEDGIITVNVELDGAKDTTETAEVTATLEDNTIVIVVENNKITTTRTVQKVWNMPAAEAINYRATLTLYKVVNGQKIAVTNADGTDRTAVITGNDTAVFDNLEVYENDELITYYIEETKIEKCVGIDQATGNEVWEDVTGKFIVDYKN